MTPLESELLQRLGVDHLLSLEALSIYVFFYGVYSSLVARVCLIHKFDNRIVRCTLRRIGARYLCVGFLLLWNRLFLNKTSSLKLDRRKGFSNRAAAAMFAVTVINFLLSSLNTGSQVASFIVFIRKALILDIDHPLSEKQEPVTNALRNINIVSFWAESLPVSITLLLPDPILIHGR